MAVKNSETDEIAHICSGGPSTDCGFFKNGEIYSFGSNLLVYSPETYEVTFNLEENFPIHDPVDKSFLRIIFTFRRDPEDKTFVILYYEGDMADMYADADGREDPVSFYKIGYLDAEGSFIKSFESEIPLQYNMYRWPQEAVFHYSGGIYTVSTMGSKGTYGINFSFDTKTETFSEPAKNEYWPR